MTEEKRLDELKAEEKTELSEEALEQAAGGGCTAAPGGPKLSRPGR